MAFVKFSFEVQVQVPGGIVTVSPLTAELIAVSTSVLEQVAAGMLEAIHLAEQGLV